MSSLSSALEKCHKKYYFLCRPQPSDISSKDATPVFAILPYSKGFICSSGPGTIHIFEKTEDRNTFKKVRPVSIWVDPANHVEQAITDVGYDNDILSITFSPSEENVVCSTRSQQLYSLTLSAADLGKVQYNRITIIIIL